MTVLKSVDPRIISLYFLDPKTFSLENYRYFPAEMFGPRMAKVYLGYEMILPGY